MDAIIRAAVVYLVLLVLFRIAGKRTLSQMTTFDFVLLLIIGEAVQQALLGEDFSLTNAFLIVVTFLGIDILLSLLKQRSQTLEKVVDGVPLVVLREGKLIKEHMDKVRVDEADIMTAARQMHGVENLTQIKYAVVERSGGITIVPWQEAGERESRK